MMRTALATLTMSCLLVGCGPERARVPGQDPRLGVDHDYTLQTLQQAVPSLWDDATYFSVDLHALHPQLHWRERAITVRVEGRRPLLQVREEQYLADPKALNAKPEVLPPSGGSPYWAIRLTCRQPACLQVDGRDDANPVSERRDANFWFARDEASARALAATLEAALATPAD